MGNKERRRERKVSKRARRRSIDVEDWVVSNLDKLINIVGIGYLDLPDNAVKDILIKITEILIGESKKIDLETFSRRYKRYIQQIKQIISLGILNNTQKLSEDQLEYILSSTGPWIINYGDRLYYEITRYGRSDLLNVLRYEWNKWWTQSKSSELPPQCPRCGFNSLMPDYVCIVCKHVASEKEILNKYNFESYIKNLIKSGKAITAREIMQKGYILVSSTGIKEPGSKKEPLDLEVHLDYKYRNKLKELLKNIIE